MDMNMLPCVFKRESLDSQEILQIDSPVQCFVWRFRRFMLFCTWTSWAFQGFKNWQRNDCTGLKTQFSRDTHLFPMCFIVVRCGVDGGMVVDFLEMCLSHGMGQEAELKDLIKKIQSF